jgi:hypothetical protein
VSLEDALVVLPNGTLQQLQDGFWWRLDVPVRRRVLEVIQTEVDVLGRRHDGWTEVFVGQQYFDIVSKHESLEQVSLGLGHVEASLGHQGRHL